MKHETEITNGEIREMCLEAMRDKAVTNISGWTEPNSDEPCDESVYRKRLAENAPGYIAKIKGALKF